MSRVRALFEGLGGWRWRIVFNPSHLEERIEGACAGNKYPRSMSVKFSALCEMVLMCICTDVLLLEKN